MSKRVRSKVSAPISRHGYIAPIDTAVASGDEWHVVSKPEKLPPPISTSSSRPLDGAPSPSSVPGGSRRAPTRNCNQNHDLLGLLQQQQQQQQQQRVEGGNGLAPAAGQFTPTEESVCRFDSTNRPPPIMDSNCTQCHDNPQFSIVNGNYHSCFPSHQLFTYQASHNLSSMRQNSFLTHQPSMYHLSAGQASPDYIMPPYASSGSLSDGHFMANFMPYMAQHNQVYKHDTLSGQAESPSQTTFELPTTKELDFLDRLIDLDGKERVSLTHSHQLQTQHSEDGVPRYLAAGCTRSSQHHNKQSQPSSYLADRNSDTRGEMAKKKKPLVQMDPNRQYTPENRSKAALPLESPIFNVTLRDLASRRGKGLL